jgi:hypothetical protein
MGAFFNLYSGSLAAFRIRLRLSEGGFSGRSLNGKYAYIREESFYSVIAFHDFDVGS